MIFLPIVRRELGVAARKRSTVWLRIAAALVGLLIAGGVLLASERGGMGSAAPGRGLFLALTWICLVAAATAGLFFTSDCLSEEKREGTLGFLFLTDLRGYDVVLGKLLATSLRGTYAMLALFPVLAVTLTMGGVTGAYFWRTVLALLNALFVSLAVGLLVSAVSRDSQRALAGTLLVLVLLVLGGPAFDAALAAMEERAFVPMLSLASPGYVFVQAGASGFTPFCSGLLVNQLIGWGMLACTCWWLPHTRTECVQHGSSGDRRWRDRWRFGGVKRPAGLRRELMEVNAVLWLVCRERWQAGSVWFLAILVLGGFVAVGVQGHAVGWMIWSGGVGLVMLAVHLGIASQAGRFFSEGRRSGLLELLLATPLQSGRIVEGQWRALLRMFGLPLALMLVAQLLGSILAQQAAGNPRAVGAGGTAIVTFGVGFGSANPALAATQSAMSTVAAAINLAAIAWVGMWMGLTSRSVGVATLKTIVFVQVIPWFLISVVSALILPLLVFQDLIGGSSPLVNWMPFIMTGVPLLLNVAKDVGFALWARRRLRTGFRERASGVFGAAEGVRARPPGSRRSRA